MKLSLRITPLVLCLLWVVLVALPVAAQENTGPWDMERLSQPPESVEWTADYEMPERNILVREVFYESEPFEGHPTRVFAYYARPLNVPENEKLPAMVLVHGGGGTAFREWAELWAARGYAALAMDTAGCVPGQGHQAAGGPDQGDDEKFRDFTDDEADQMWTYHAVAAAVRGHSLLASLEEVDADRIGITGISWGGYLTCIVAGIDHRLKVAIPVYGCGYLDRNSYWIGPQFDKMETNRRERWVRYFDPSVYLPGVECPILFVTGTNDFAYPLDSLQGSYEEVPGEVDLCVRVRMPHGHPQGWAPREIGRYTDWVLRSGTAPIEFTSPQREGQQVEVDFTSPLNLSRAELHFAPAEGRWQDRGWQTVEASFDLSHTAGEDYTGQIMAQLPETDTPLVWYLSATDTEGCLWSTPHAIAEP